jgi:hypothetical protein
MSVESFEPVTGVREASDYAHFKPGGYRSKYVQYYKDKSFGD